MLDIRRQRPVTMSAIPKSHALFIICNLISLINASCFYQSPPFPAPDYTKPCPELLEAFNQIEASISALVTDPALNTSSYSVEITSSRSTLWSTFHTAVEKDLARPGAEEVDGNSAYRIASITKVFTVLGILQQHKAGNLSLDDPVDRYIADLKALRHEAIPWKDITLRSLASQLSGIPRDWAQGDLALLEDPSTVGLPPATFSGLPKCDSLNTSLPCTEKELLDSLATKLPVFTPNQKSTYSNIAFELLGLVLANVTGLSYEQYIEGSILAPLNMTGTSFSKPPDSVAVRPKGDGWYWDVDQGVQNPTGGLYCSSSDMSKFLRYVLTHYKNITNAINWLHPASFSPGVNSFYGMPWEIFRTNKILNSPERPATFVTKGGGLPGYTTVIMIVPEYELGITLFTAGNTTLLSQMQEIITVPLIQAADRVARRQLQDTYTGFYTASQLNSSIALSYSTNHGLEITRWISNATDMLAVISSLSQLDREKLHVQIIPTLLFRDQEHLKGELWRFTPLQDRPDSRHVWDDFCESNVDLLMYAGKPLNEMAFWDKDERGRYGTVELTAFRISLTRDGGENVVGDGLITQDP